MSDDLYSRSRFPPAELPDGLPFVGSSAAMERLRLQVRRIAPHLRIALITGERGTGKQHTARTLHSLSGKDAATFLWLRSLDLQNVDTDQAGGKRPTCYLPELCTLAPREQAELMASIRCLEAQPASRRPQLIVSTREDLRGLVAAGQFHPELYSRISSVEITLPPLRSRVEDIPEIVAALLRAKANNHPAETECDGNYLLDGRALSRLKGYAWPGNLRELARVIDQASRHARTGCNMEAGPDAGARSRVIELMHLPRLEADSVPCSREVLQATTERLDEVIERHVLGVLLRCSGNKVRAAERLGISRSTLYRMLEANPSSSSLSRAS